MTLCSDNSLFLIFGDHSIFNAGLIFKPYFILNILFLARTSVSLLTQCSVWAHLSLSFLIKLSLQIMLSSELYACINMEREVTLMH